MMAFAWAAFPYTGLVRPFGRGVNKRLIARAVACEPTVGCGACLLVCPDFCFEIYQYETPVSHEVTP